VIKYFQTTITPPFKKGESVVVYCKATKTEKDWTVCLVHTDSSTPFITVMNGVNDNFFKGAEEIQHNFYLAQINFIGNLAS